MENNLSTVQQYFKKFNGGNMLKILKKIYFKEKGNGSGGRCINGGDDSGGRFIIIDGSGTDSGDDKFKY